MKKLIIASILLITLVACKKTTTNPQRTNNTVLTTDYSGTYVNPNNNTDYIKLTTTISDHNGNKRYFVNNFNYNHCMSCNGGLGLNQDTVLESALLNAPGWYIQSYNSNNPSNPDNGYVLYTNNTIKFDLFDCITGTNKIHTIYAKQ